MATPLDRRAVAAWCLYDWANSAFPTVVTTFVFATYFTQSVAPDVVSGTAAWGRATAAAGLAIALISPFVGAMADARGRRKPWLLAFTVLLVAGSAALWFVRPVPGDMVFALVAVALATVAFEVAIVFYNALLPAVAPSSHLGRVSGWGWGIGYLGGIACLAALLFGFVQNPEPPFGLDRAAAEHVRIVGPFVAVWIALFAAPVFLALREPRPPMGSRMAPAAALRAGLRRLAATPALLRRAPAFGWFLLAHMIYTDGLTTLFAFGAIYAAGTYGMSIGEVILFGIAINVTAGAGALAAAPLDDRIGSRRTILASLAALAGVSALLLLWTGGKAGFWALGLLIGPFLGPVQAASRSLCARLASADDRAQCFGLFALSGRITAFVGPALLASVTEATGSQRWGMATILPFVVVGGLLLWRSVPEPRRTG